MLALQNERWIYILEVQIPSSGEIIHKLDQIKLDRPPLAFLMLQYKKLTYFMFWCLFEPQHDLWPGELWKMDIKYIVTSFWGAKRPQKAVGGLMCLG